MLEDDNIKQSVPPEPSDILMTSAVSNGSSGGDCSADQSSGEQASISVVWGKERFSVAISLTASVANLKQEIQKLSGVPPQMQKLMFKGILKDDEKSLKESGVAEGARIMLIGCTAKDVAAVNTAPDVTAIRAESEAAKQDKDNQNKTEHQKIISKGVPEDAMVGIKNAQDSLPDTPITGMVGKGGEKVRLTFKLETDELWIGTKVRTNKVPMSQITSIISEPIREHEEYHMMAIQLGPTEQSRYWIYWVPAQYITAIKQAVLGPVGHLF